MTRSNNFDALRLAGAAAVIIGHAFHMLGRPAEMPLMFGYHISTLGVVVFFSISGFLISASWTRKRALVPYLLARCLRIFPGLVVLVLVTVLVIGPAVTALPTGDYFAAPATLDYLRNIAMEPRYALPGVFDGLPYPSVANGSLWTLPAEFLCYLVVPLACVSAVRLRIPLVSVLLAVSLYLAHVPPEQSSVVYGTRITDAAAMWVFFCAGALLQAVHSRRPGVFRLDVAVLALLADLAMVALVPAAVPWLTWVFLPYAILAVGLASTPVVRRAARFGDLSYGTYLWAFPIQQLIVLQWGVQRMAVNLVVVTLLSLALAWLSWHAIEAPSLRLKDRLVRRAGSAPLRQTSHVGVTTAPGTATVAASSAASSGR